MAPTADDRKPKVALIMGISGQSGSYLAELLLEKGYEVLKNRTNVQSIDMLTPRFRSMG